MTGDEPGHPQSPLPDASISPGGLTPHERFWDEVDRVMTWLVVVAAATLVELHFGIVGADGFTCFALVISIAVAHRGHRGTVALALSQRLRAHALPFLLNLVALTWISRTLFQWAS